MGIKNFLRALFLTLLTLSAFGQEAYVRHTVLAGETVNTIARQYNIGVGDVVKYNPDVSDGLREGAILIIPQKKGKNVNAQEVITHTVEPKETLYGLSKKYNCSVDELLALNPELSDGLKVGSTIKVPKPKAQTVSATPAVAGNYQNYTVQAKETVYSITRANGITEEQFLAINPEVRESGLKEGQVVRLPLAAAPVVAEQVATDRPVQAQTAQIFAGAKAPLFWHVPAHGQGAQIRVAVLVPLYLAEADSAGKNFEKSRVGLQFLAGFKLAMDTLAALGYTIELDVFDTPNDEASVARIAKEIHPKTQIIFGPFYAKGAEQLAGLLPGKTIVSPLSKAVDNATRPNLIDAINFPNAEMAEMAEWINPRLAKQRFVFISTDTAANRKAVDYITQRLSGMDTNNTKFIWSKRPSSALGSLDAHRKPGRKTNFVVVDQNPAFIIDVMRRLYRRRDTNMVLITTSKIFDITALENRQLNQVNFIGTSPDFVDYTDPGTQLFIKQYRKATGTEPTKYGYNGYDTGLYFAQLIAAYGTLPDVAVWPEVHGVFKGFKFVEEGNGGPVNVHAYSLGINNYKIVLRGQ